MKIPLFVDPVEAGFPSMAYDYLEQNLNLNEHLIPHPAATFFVRVNGHSMKDAGIHHDDILIVDRSLQAGHGKIVIAVINGEFTVKRLCLHGEKVILEPENKEYKAIVVPPQSDFQVWGVVTYVIHKCSL